ncbi:MAG: class I SAM-dependent methyltransferase [Chloroflexi bacterium]|nr:MAG: class I SAM-dependent methyltransferase [Chloroflexota bacterium]
MWHLVKFDPIASQNRDAWERLAASGHHYTVPHGDPGRTHEEWRDYIDSRGRLPGFDFHGKRVLALAAGGGWEPVLFAKLGAETTLFDLTPSQIHTVRNLASREGVNLHFVEGDMRDLGPLRDQSFDLVWHAHSLNFIDDAERVFNEVGRVLAPLGIYLVLLMNPYVQALYETWTGSGYLPRQYPWKGPLPWKDNVWRHGQIEVEAPTLDFQHSLETLIGGIVAAGLVVTGLWEVEGDHDPTEEVEPGSDLHVESIFRRDLEIRAQKPPAEFYEILTTG